MGPRPCARTAASHRVTYRSSAYDEIIAASNLLHGNMKSPDYRGTPSAVFTTLSLAAVGLTEVDARRQGLDVRLTCV